jgi:hypothetical protein
MESGAPVNAGGPVNAIIVGLKYQLKGLDLDIKAIREASNKVRKQIVVYQTRIENTPKREQELVDLTRDYDNLRLSYESLLTRKIEATQAAALERRQKGEQFRVVDPARIPVVAFKPDVKKVLAMAFLLAVGTGLGLALGLEYLSKAFYDPDDVKKALNISVLACVPLLLTDAEKQRRVLKYRCGRGLCSGNSPFAYFVVQGRRCFFMNSMYLILLKTSGLWRNLNILACLCAV